MLMTFWALNTFMYTRKCRCVFTSLPPSCLIYCICAPSHVYFGYAFSPHVFGLPFSSRRHISRNSYFSYSFAVDIFLGPAYLGYVLFDVQPGPGTPSAQIFSLMHQHWQIDPKYAASSLKSIISVSILAEIFFFFQRSGRCGATCSKSTATWRSLSFYRREADRQSFILKKFMYL